MAAKTVIMKWMFQMMRLPTCEEVDQFAYDFLEGRLDVETMHQVQRHLRVCKNCRRFFDSYRKMRDLGHQPLTITLDSEFKEKLLQYLSQTPSAS